MMKKKADDYGWKNIGELPSQSLLFPELKKILLKINPKTILDFGCGNGGFTRRIQELGFDVSGCDIDRVGIEIARKNNRNIPFFLMGEKDPFENAAFDVILSTEVIEHMFNPQELMSFARNHLPLNGYLIISTPYHGYLKNLAISFFDLWDKHHHPLRIGGHIKFWSIKTISELFSANGFDIEKIAGVGRISILMEKHGRSVKKN